MGEQVRKVRSSLKRREEASSDLPQKQTPEQRQKHLEELDNLIEDIDEVLEENAEDFVRSYVQKGGQ